MHPGKQTLNVSRFDCLMLEISFIKNPRLMIILIARLINVPHMKMWRTPGALILAIIFFWVLHTMLFFNSQSKLTIFIIMQPINLRYKVPLFPHFPNMRCHLRVFCFTRKQSNRFIYCHHSMHAEKNDWHHKPLRYLVKINKCCLILWYKIKLYQLNYMQSINFCIKRQECQTSL